MAGKERKENPQSDMIAEGSNGGETGMKSLPGSAFCSWKIGSVINIRIPHGTISQRNLPCWRRKWEDMVSGGGLVQRKMFSEG